MRANGENSMLIYKATNVANGKVYIGQTKNTLEERKKEHIRDSSRLDTYFYRAIRKYGSESFVWEVIHDNIQTQEELNYYEQYYIKLYDSFDNKEKGYNTTSGGNSGYILTTEECQKRSERVKGENNPMYGKPGTWTGKQFSEEHKKHLRESLINRPHDTIKGSQHYYAKSVINLSTGEIFGSLVEAAEHYNVDYNCISNHLHGKTKRCCGCQWSYLEDIDLENFKPLNNMIESQRTQKRKIYVLEHNQVYTKLKEAAKALGCSVALISLRCKDLADNEYGIINDCHVKYIK